MNGLPDSVIWDGPMIVGKNVLMMFTDEETGSSFGLKPEESDFHNIQAHAVTMRTEHKRRHPWAE